MFPRSQINRKYEGSGQTPLHLAAGCGDQAMIGLLLRMGAAVGQYIETNNNQSSLHTSPLTCLSYIVGWLDVL